MRVDALTGVLLIPAIAAALLAVLPGYRMTARLNVASDDGHAPLRTVAVLAAAADWPLSPGRRSQCHLHRAHDVSRYHHQRVQRELYRPPRAETGRLTPPFVRFYHAMYQVLMFAIIWRLSPTISA